MSQPKTKLSTSDLAAKHANEQPPIPAGSLMVCLHNIRSMHNVGSAFRSADAFAVSKLLLTGYTPHPPRIEISKTALGADEWVDWEHQAEALPTFARYREDGWTLVAVEQTVRSLPMPAGIPDPRRHKVMLIFGNEVLGLDDEVIALCEHVADIPQYGKKHSLNVSVSIGIALFAAHQRALKG